MDTACSSALVAAHLAAQQLARAGGAALAAGVNLMLAEATTAGAQGAGMLSPDGRCKGVGRGSGRLRQVGRCLCPCNHTSP